ncbi:glycosyltransferase family 2 protein [Candidatus Beckwithbacteria bacterium]|nr:glycosyltransferase family 2 protein [Candidatus Beckwithbacteria bacterium]
MKLSIIITSYNTKALLDTCLNSLYTYLPKIEFEVVVVDNASSDDSVAYVKKNFPKVTIIANKKNVGFGAANNQGVAKASGDLILLLNSDAYLIDNSLQTFLLKQSDKKENFTNTIIGAQLLNSDQSIQASAGFAPTLIRVWLQMLFVDDLPIIDSLLKSYQESRASFYKKRRSVDWVTGAFMLMPKELFNNIGGFDESIFMYGEEVDLCFRAKKQNTNIIFDPNIKLVHAKGGSSQDGFAKAIQGEYQGLWHFYQKHFPKKRDSLAAALQWGALLRSVLFAIISPDKAKVYRALLENSKNYEQNP